MTERALLKLNAHFPLKRLDPGEYGSFKASPLTVRLDWYRAEGLGNVSLLHGKAMGGLMRMETLVIDPFLRDAPLFSYDYIAAMGKHTLLVEYYDTLIDPEGFDAAGLLPAKDGVAALPEHDLGVHWYDGLKLPASFAKRTNKTELPRLEIAFLSALDAYLLLAEQKPPLDDEAQSAKREKAGAYVNGLLSHGGPSTDAFAKAIGPARTKELFTRIVFGTEPPRI